jgi:hypothetical protein
MKKLILCVFATQLIYGILQAQEDNNCSKFIEVSGSAEMLIEPDEVRFQIGIEEYWKEEFEKNKEYKDYITKIPLAEIEKNLMQSLTAIGIVKKQLITRDIGQHWNSAGKNFKKSKTIELIITDMSQLDSLLTQVNVRGVNSMHISKLKNKDLSKYRQQVKIEAIKAGKIKAGYLLESVGESLGRLISVIELNHNSGSIWQPRDMLSNSRMTATTGDDSAVNLRKIKLKYDINIRFEIK